MIMFLLIKVTQWSPMICSMIKVLYLVQIVQFLMIYNVGCLLVNNMLTTENDGAGSSFKNQCNLGNLVHKEDFGFELDWSFFEIAHGKRPADGIGAIVK